MSLSVSQVMGSEPEALLGAATDLRSAASGVESQIVAERSHLARLATGWTGTSADVAQDHAEEMIGDQVAYHGRLTALQAELNTAGEDLGHFRAELSNQVNSAEAQYFDVADDGSVSLGVKLKILVALSPLLALKFGLRRLALQTAIQTALHQFDAADKAAAYAIRRMGGTQ